MTRLSERLNSGFRLLKQAVVPVCIGAVVVVATGCSSSSSNPPVNQKLSGVIVDPYIKWARVSCYKSDGTLKAVAPTLSNAKGEFQFAATDTCDNAAGDYLAMEPEVVDASDNSGTGWKDKDGNVVPIGSITTHVDGSGTFISEFIGVMKAPAGATYISPLTNMVQALVASGAATDLAQAEAQVKKALGIADVAGDLGSIDINAAGNERTLAAAVVVQQLVADSAGALQGVAGGAPVTPDAFANVAAAVAKALSSAAAANTPILDNTGTVQLEALTQAVSTTIADAVSAPGSAYAGFDAAAIYTVVAGATTANVVKAADAAKAGSSSLTTALQQTQGAGSEVIRAATAVVKDYVNGSLAAQIAANPAAAAQLVAQRDALLNAVSASVATTVKNTTTLTGVTSIATVLTQNVPPALADAVTASGVNLTTVAAAANTALANQVVLSQDAPNTAPVAVSETIVASAGTAAGYVVSLKASDINGDKLTFSNVAVKVGATAVPHTATGNTVTINQALAQGSYTITFTVSDGKASANGTVTLRVDPVAAPIAPSSTVYVDGQGTVKGLITAFDLAQKPLTFTFAASTCGAPSITGNTYSVNVNAASCTLTYTASNGAQSASGVITFKFTNYFAVNSVSVNNGTAVTVDGFKANGTAVTGALQNVNFSLSQQGTPLGTAKSATAQVAVRFANASGEVLEFAVDKVVVAESAVTQGALTVTIPAGAKFYANGVNGSTKISVSGVTNVADNSMNQVITATGTTALGNLSINVQSMVTKVNGQTGGAGIGNFPLITGTAKGKYTATFVLKGIDVGSTTAKLGAASLTVNGYTVAGGGISGNVTFQ